MIACIQVDASLQQHAHKKIQSADGEDKHEEYKDENGVLQEQHGTHYRLNHSLQRFNLVYRTQGT